MISVIAATRRLSKRSDMLSFIYALWHWAVASEYAYYKKISTRKSEENGTTKYNKKTY